MVIVRRSLLALVLALVWALPVHAQAVFDNAQQATSGTGTSLSITIDCSGTNTVLYVGVAEDVSAAVTTPTVTHNSDAVGLLDELQETDTGQWTRYLGVFRRIAPASGSQTVSITGLDAAANQKHAIAYCVTGADQTTPEDATVTSFGVASTTGITTTTGSITSGANDLVIDFVAIDGGSTGPTLTVASGTIPTNGQSDNAMVLSSSWEDTGTVTKNWDWTGAQNFVHIVINVNEAAGAAAAPPKLMLLGVGGESCEEEEEWYDKAA